MGRIFTQGIILALAAAAAIAQDPPVFRSDVQLVRLLVTVKDGNGQLVGGLDKDAFEIRDSGIRQDIAVFERHTAQPLSIALMLDASGSTAKDIKYEIDASARFLKALIAEGNSEDALAFFTFNHDVQQLSGFTRNPARIARSFERVKAEAGTSLYDAIALGSEALEIREGRKVIIVVTDGGDTTSRYDFHRALRAAHGAEAVIYAIVVVPITNNAGRNIGGENALITMTKSTGGRAFFPALGPELDRTFAGILRDLRTQYLIGYYPKNLPESEDRFRQVKVGVDREGLTASTRSGYYAR